MKKLLAVILLLLMAASASAVDVKALIKQQTVISRRVASVLDVPSAPQISNGGKTCQITGSAVANATSYKLYRGYGLGKTLIDTQASYSFEVDDNVLGSPQYYCVQAAGAGGELSGFSADAEYWPVSTLTLRSPCYMLMQWRDYPDVLLTQAQIDTLATFDVIGESPHLYEGGGTIELAYGTKAGGDDLVTRVRTKATAVDGHNVAFVTYLFGNAARLDWSTQQESHPYVSPYVFGPYPSSGTYSRNDVHPRIWDWCVANDGFLKNKDTGQPLINPVYPVYNYNYGNPDMPAALAEIYVDGFEGSAMDGEYCGFLYDFINTDVQGWTCDRTKVDLDGDGIAYTNDSADEAEIYRQWHLNVVKALRREFAERGMDNRLIVVNGNGVQNSAMNSSVYGELSQWVDGFMQERWNDGTTGYPGWRNATDLTANWQSVISEYCNTSKYLHAQTRPYGFIWHMYADDQLPEISAVPAIATNGWAHANSPGKHIGCSAGETCYVRACNGEVRISDLITRLPTPGAISSVLIQEKPIPPGDTFCDTLTVVAANLKSRLALRPVGTTKGSWPYLYTQKGADGYYGTADDVIVARHSSWPLATVNVTAADGSSTWTNDTSHTITGTGFGSTKTGSCKVEVCNSPYYGSCTVKDEQTTTSWGSTSITLTYSVDTGEPVTGWLYVTDSTGNVSPAWKITRQTVAAPVASFTGGDTSHRAPYTVNFTDTSTGTPTSWDWDWGDGTAHGTTQNPSHQYTTGSSYNVTLTVTNAGGSDDVTVNGAVDLLDPYWYPSTYTLSMAAGKLRAMSFVLSPTGGGTINVRVYNDDTNTQIGADQSSSATPPSPAGVTVANGTFCRIEYWVSTAPSGYAAWGSSSSRLVLMGRNEQNDAIGSQSGVVPVEHP